MFRTLSLRAKILALPLVAAVGFLTTLGTTFVLGSRSQAQLERLEMQESPAFETSQKLQSQLEVYQRALRDAVGASDTGAVVAADSIARTFVALSDSLARNASVDSTAVRALGADFKGYAAQARSTSMGMISGSMEDMMGGMQGVKTKYAALSKSLQEQTTERQAAIAAAFGTARTLQSTTRLVTSVVLIISLVALGLLAVDRGHRDRAGQGGAADRHQHER
jgi:methyl-accepting chemotaxis protein